MKNLYLLRHAKAKNAHASGKDVDREIEEKGKEQLKNRAAFLKTYEFSNDFNLLISTAKRTRQSYAALKGTLVETSKLKEVLLMDELYLASYQELLSIICQQNTENDLFIIGHNNGLSDLATYLTDEMILLATCDFIHLQFDVDSWAEVSQGMGSIKK